MKKFFAICLTLAILLGMLPMAVSAAEEATPISSVDEITDLTASYVLTQDITVSAPIGAFSGSFDGDGHTVTINITATTSNAGMFTTIASGAEVKNFKIANSTLTNNSYEYTGLVAGTNNGTVSDIIVENSTVTGYTTVGGIVGRNSGTVTNCAFESGTVMKGDSTDTGFGGIVGENSGTVTLCSNNATIDHSGGRSNYDYTGGIVGRNQYNGTVTHCFNSGALSDGANKSYYVGGVSGQNNGTVDASHNTGLITSTSSRVYGVASTCTNSYYLDTCGASTGGTSKTADEFASLAAALGENWVDGSDGYPVLVWQTWKYSNTAIKYVVEYYTETLEEGVFELYSSNEVKAEPDTEVSAGTPAIEGFTFDESNENNILTGSASAELVLKCYYTRNSYTLTWDVGEGTITSEEGAYTAGSVKYGAAITYPEVSNPGYSVSWDQTLATMPAADTTVTATWKTASYPVTWDANGGVFETEDSWGDVTTSDTLTWSSNSGTTGGAIYGQTLGKYRWSETSTSFSNRSLPAPIHESLVFGGWYTAAEGGEEVTVDTVVTIPESGSFTYYAHWTEAWTVTFDADGGRISGDSTVLVGKGETFGSAASIPTATKTGHSLAGWFDAEGNALTADTVINGDVTYTAQWTPNTYTVTFHANGGEGTMEPQTFTYGVPQNISKNLFTREGYQFIGWGTWSSASSPSYTDEQEYTIGSYNQNFYAIWEELRYSLTFNVVPEGAEIVVKNANGTVQTATDGVYNLLAGTYTYTASLYGYVTVEGTVELSENTVLDITLEKLPTYTVSFNVTKPADAGETVITVTDAEGVEITASEDGSYKLIPGTYNYLVTAKSCNKAKAEFTVVDSDLAIDIELVISYAWDGTTKTEPATISAEEAVGEYEGMEGWYLITNGEELAWFADKVNATSSGYTGNAVLAKDIDLGGETWTPMGYSWSYYFNGTFDGNGHSILGLYCDGADYQGLFGYSKGTVKNLTVYGEVNSSNSNLGGIVAYQSGGSILNCGAYVDCTSTYGYGRNGGVAGYISGTTVDSCFYAGTLTGGRYQGGIVGYAGGTSKISNCYNVGTLVEGVVSESSGSYGCSGGIYGYTSEYNNTTVENCYNAGDLSLANTRIGAIGGEAADSTTFTNCYYLDTLSKSAGYGVVGSDNSTAVSSETLKSAETLAALGEAYKADGADAQSINSGYPILVWQVLPEAECTHENTTTTTVAPTCTEDGSVTVTCDDCGATISTETTPATDHDFTYTNNGNDHTVTCANGCAYDVTEGHTYVDGACVCGAIEPVEETITVYAINSSNWSEVYAYVWCSVGSYEVAWPGTAMTKTEDTVNGFDVYSYTYPATNDMLIFNNNSNGSQTSDLVGLDGKYYDIKTATWYDSLDEVPAIDPLATGVYMAGEFNGWTTLEDEFKRAEATDTVATLTLELDAETAYQFKVVNNGTWTSCVEAITGTVSGISFSAANNTNATITTVAAGTYTFTYDLVNNTLSVTYPEVIPAGPTEIELKFYHSMSFDADLKVNFRLALDEIEAVIPNYVLEGAYLELEKDRYTSGGEKTVDETTVTYTVDDAANRLVFSVVGIQSVEMGSELRAVLHIFDSEGKEYVTQVDTYSVLTYVTNNLAKNDGKNNEFCTLLVDALNYGAAAQIFFDRRTDELVNAGIDAYQHYATQSLREELTASKETVTTEREITAVDMMNFSMSFDEMTKMNVKLTLTGDYTKSDITAVKVFRADGTLVETFTTFTELEDGRLQVTFTGVKSIMMRDMFYFEAYVGEQLASDRYGYSMEAYAKSNVNSTNTEFGDMVLKCMYYGDSAASYFQGE